MPQVTCQSDVLDPTRAQALAVTLDSPETYIAGDPLPHFFHQIYFWNAQPAGALGRDGHPKVGALIPDTGLPRRMWAGGRLRFLQALRAGQPAEKRSQCEAAVHKNGRSGPLAFVTLRHDFYQGETLCISEWQDLVYREDTGGTAVKPAAPRAPVDEETRRTTSFSSTMLFRYSALTFNGHRIHYDLPYAQEVEGYDGLVVHGPLLAQLMMVMAQDELGPLAAFSFRATAPLMHFETAQLCRKGNTLWVRGPGGRQCMTAQASVASE